MNKTLSQVWTVAESCAQLEELAAEFLTEAVDCREGMKRGQELEAVKRRAAFKLIAPKNIQREGLPAIPIGREQAFYEALEQHQKEMSEIYPA